MTDYNNTFIKTNHYQNGVCQIIDMDNLTILSIRKQNKNPDDYVTVVSLVNNLIMIFNKNDTKPLTSTEEFKSQINSYQSLPSLNSNLLWSERYKLLTDLLKQNTITNFLMVIKDILNTKKPYTFGQCKMLELTCSLFITEYSIVHQVSKTEAFELLKKITNHNLQIVKNY